MLLKILNIPDFLMSLRQVEKFQISIWRDKTYLNVILNYKKYFSSLQKHEKRLPVLRGELKNEFNHRVVFFLGPTYRGGNELGKNGKKNFMSHLPKFSPSSIVLNRQWQQKNNNHKSIILDFIHESKHWERAAKN